MAAINGKTETLQTKAHRELLDTIGRLRSQGFTQYVDLPQIIVCGDQSCGKSSVLEAISGMSFPAKDNLCTRFTTELILRRNPVSGITITIIPGSERSDKDKVVEGAKDAMGLSGGGKVFSTDVLRIEISGPSQPHLTLVDLPGLFVAGNKAQSEADAALVKELVLSYMKNPRTIILTVVSAKSDFALQQVTEHIRAQDPSGSLTLGLITKPDTLDEGSDNEQAYLELAKNKDVVQRARGIDGIRDAAEAEFFAKGVWKSLSPSQLGISALRARLSDVLRQQKIVSQLPNLLEDIAKRISECKSALERLGVARATLAEQRLYLLRISAIFSEIVKAAIDGVYTDPFFKGSPERGLRAVVQSTLANFAKGMRRKGHAREIVDASLDFDTSENRKLQLITRSEYIKEVKTLMLGTRGRELPGTYNPLIVAQLISRQCQLWQGMVQNLSETVVESTAKVIGSILGHIIADRETADSLDRLVVQPAIEKVKQDLKSKTDEIMEQHLSGHPITYNHHMTRFVQQARRKRKRRELEKTIETLQLQRIKPNYQYQVNLHHLLSFLATDTEPDMDTHSCSMAVDTMEAYYTVALEAFIDTISTQAVERCLLQRLPSILTPEVVCDLSDDVIAHIASENPDAASEREQVTEKLSVLEDALVQLRRLGAPDPQSAGEGT